jgi:PTH1 family peptidyl-tRNA hydrolase
VGFAVVAAFAERHHISLDRSSGSGHYGEGEAAGLRAGLLLPQTFMNASGEAVAAAILGHPELDVSQDLVIVYDDLDLPLGRMRLRASGGAGGHRGIASIIDALGHRDFARLRFGIGRPPSGIEVIDYVLSPFSEGEQIARAEQVDRAVDALEAILEEGMAPAMDRFNAEPPSGAIS